MEPLVPHPQRAMHDATIRKRIKNSGERFAKLASPEHTIIAATF
jgi:hypothetical protein